MVLVIHSAPLNCQMQSTRIPRIGGLSEIWEIVVTIVADVPPEPDSGISYLTRLVSVADAAPGRVEGFRNQKREKPKTTHFVSISIFT
jgi:hypothetical protein